ncbi:MAG: protein kinase [Nannocystaceae bacterium]
MSKTPDPGLAAGKTLEAAKGEILAHTEIDGHSAPPAPKASIDDAARVGRFQVLHEIGQGGMGVVYAAYDWTLDRKVALKVLRSMGGSHTRANERLHREAQAMARITHPNVVQIYEVAEHQGQIYVAMEFIDGVELTKWIADESLGWSEIIDVFIQAGRGLQAAHEAGVVHRDFKPDNVVMTRRTSSRGRDEVRAKVLDFGIAAVARGDPTASSDGLELEGEGATTTRLTLTGSVMGTPRYMSPEHFLGRGNDPRSDQFSFAVALYEALYEERPFVGESYNELREAVLAGTLRPSPPSDVPAWVRDTLARALARRPEDRWSSMEELLTVLVEHPERTQDPDLDRTVALRQRVWMFSVLTVGAVSLLGVLLYRWRYGSAQDLAEYAHWSKVIFAGVAILTVIATKHIFLRNTYNRWVAAMLLSLAAGTIAVSFAARALALPPGETDRFVLIVIAVSFGQASAGINRWYVVIALFGFVGLIVSAADPFVASVVVGLCVAVGTGLTTYAWRRRRGSGRRMMTTRSTASDLERASTDGERGRRDRRERSSGG